MTSKDEIQMSALAADMDGMKSAVCKLSEEVSSLRKQLEGDNSREAEPMASAQIPIVSNTKVSQTDFYSPLESLEDAIDDLNEEVLARAASVNDSILSILNKLDHIDKELSTIRYYNVKMSKCEQEYKNEVKKMNEIFMSTSPKTELTQWHRISLNAKSWFNKEFITDFRVLVLLLYFVLSSAIAIGYAVMYNKAKCSF